MSENRFSPGPGTGGCKGGDTRCVCIETNRIFDSCRDRDCYEHVRVFLTDLGEDIIELIWHDEGEIFEIIFECVVGLVEPELIEVENTSLVAVKPDGVALGFAKFASRNFVDDEWAAISIGFGVL